MINKIKLEIYKIAMLYQTEHVVFRPDIIAYTWS